MNIIHEIETRLSKISASVLLETVDTTSLVDQWLMDYDRSQNVCDTLKYNDMHLAGMGLCCLMHETPDPGFIGFDIAEKLHEYHDSILLHKRSLSEMSWRDLTDLVLGLQLEFSEVMQWDDASGFYAEIDLPEILIAVMTRMGFWLSHSWKSVSTGDGAPADVDMDAITGIVDVDSEGWSSIRVGSVIHTLDCIHSILSLTKMLLEAQLVTGTYEDCKSTVSLFNHHREASLDEFYEISMLADCLPGSVTQYKHQYRFLFHSVSQVIFFHWPSYQRKVQKAQEAIDCFQIEHMHILPLLMQVNPDIPVLFEHTGAGYMHTHKTHKFTWVCMNRYVILADDTGQTFCASDLRLLLAKASNK